MPGSFDTANLFWGLLFSAIGFGYFRYGKTQAHPVARYTGIALMVFPYFVSSNGLTLALGLGLMALPYMVGKYF